MKKSFYDAFYEVLLTKIMIDGRAHILFGATATLSKINLQLVYDELKRVNESLASQGKKLNLQGIVANMDKILAENYDSIKKAKETKPEAISSAVRKTVTEFIDKLLCGKVLDCTDGAETALEYKK